MGYLAEAHAEWHLVNGHNVVCPLDCGVGEAEADQEGYWDQEAERLGGRAVRSPHSGRYFIVDSSGRVIA